MTEKAAGTYWADPRELLNEATRAVPALKYLWTPIGLVAALAIILSFKLGYRETVLGATLVLIFAVLGLIFAYAARQSSGGLLRIPAIILVYTCLLLFVSLSLGLLSYVFLGTPKWFANVLGNASVGSVGTKAPVELCRGFSPYPTTATSQCIATIFGAADKITVRNIDVVGSRGNPRFAEDGRKFTHYSFSLVFTWNGAANFPPLTVVQVVKLRDTEIGNCTMQPSEPVGVVKPGWKESYLIAANATYTYSCLWVIAQPNPNAPPHANTITLLFGDDSKLEFEFPILDASTLPPS